MVPLDLTHSALLTEKIEERILSSNPTTFRQMWVELGRFFAHKYATVFGITAGPPLHDVCAVHIASLVGHGDWKSKRWKMVWSKDALSCRDRGRKDEGSNHM